MLLSEIKQEIVDLFKEAGVTVDLKQIIEPPKAEWGDLCLPFFKSGDKSPEELLPSLSKNIKPDGFVIKVEFVGGYFNFWLNKNKVVEILFKKITKQEKKYGLAENKQKEKIMVEFSQPNTHKEFHIGHLRSLFLGDAMVKLFRANGYKTISANYINDTGTHVAKCLWAYLKFHQKDTLPENKGEYLGQIYLEASQKFKENEQYQQEVSEVAQKIENKERKTMAIWKKTRQWSLKNFYQIYKKLGVKFDVYFFDHDLIKDGKKVVKQLLEKEIAEISDGAAIIDLKPFDLDVFLILKSDGVALYSTKDLVLAQKKFKKYKIDKSIYVVDSRQKFYFKQLFKALEAMGFKEKMYHLAYEFVSLPEGVISSRTGRIILFNDLNERMLSRAIAETIKRHPDWSEKKIKDIGKKIAYGAMKFDMLKIGSNKEIVFDMNEALKLEGFTSPYIQYTYARIASILRKAKKEKLNSKTKEIILPEAIEWELTQELLKFPVIIETTIKHYDSSVLAKYLFDLAKSFSAFYEQVPVLKAEEKLRASRLALLKNIQTVLNNGLELLGIEVMEEM